jgi:hypothetical protein
MRRELESTIGRVFPCGFIALAHGGFYCREDEFNREPMFGGTSFLYNQLVDNF